MKSDAESEPYILIAEDNSGDVALIRLALDEQGVTLKLQVQADGESAIGFVNQIDAGIAACPALVILDLNMPKIDGREVLQRIRRSGICGSVPVIVFSSSDSDRDRQVSVSLGATMYLKKPSNLEDFLHIGKTLKRMLDEQAGLASGVSG